MNPISSFFQKDALITPKTRLSITFSYQILEMEWIKALYVHKNIMFEEKNSKEQNQILNFFCCPFSPILNLFGHNFCFWERIEKKLYSHEANHFFYLQRNFQKIMRKIQPIGTCPKSHLSLEWTIVL